MSYNLTRTDGTPLLTLADGQTNTTSTSLTLIGKNYAGYGTFLNENFVKLLEHFSSVTAPDNPSVGQLWWQSSTKILKVYIGNNSWKSITGAQAEASSPTYKVTGDLWWDTTNQQLKVWSGASWITIGPSFTQTTGTSGAVADTIVDDALVTHVVVKFFVNNGLVAMLSKDSTFTPGNAIPGFSTVKPGLNLATGTVPGLKYWTTAENADYLGNVAAANYLRSDVSVPITTQLEIRNLNGIAIEETNGTVDFTLGVASNYVNMISLVRGNGMKLTTKPDFASGATIDALTVDRNSGLIRVYNDPQDALGIATKNYVDSGLFTVLSDTNANLTILGSQLTSNVLAINSNIGDIRLLKSTGSVSTPNGNVVANIVSLSANVGPLSGVIADQTTITANIKALAGNIGWTGNLSSDQLNITGNIKSFATNVGPMTFIAHQADITSNIKALAGNIGWTGNLSSDQLNITGNINSFATNVGPMSRIAHQASITANIQAIAGNIGWTGNLSSDQLNITGNIKSFATNVGPINAVGGQTIVANINALWGNVIPAGGTPGGQTLSANITAIWGNIGSVPTAGVASSVFGGQTITANVNAIWGNIVSLATTAGSISGNTDSVLRSGTRSMTGNLVPDADGTRALGALNLRFDLLGDTFDFTGTGQFHSSITTKAGINMGNTSVNGRMGTIYATTFNGTATTAQYADLAERFESDSAYPPGTVVMLGGVAEITAAMDDASDEVFGVISTRPAHLMNNQDGYTDQTHPPVAMTGRVPVRVTGTVKKGDRLISAGNGVARAAKSGEYTAFNTIGRSLENKTTTGEGVVEATVKLNS